MRPLWCPSWRLAVLPVISALVLFPHALPAPADPGDAALTLEAAMTAALARSPALAGLDHAVRARDGRVRQAGLWPNPQVGVEVENVGGSGDRNGVEQTETTFRLAQLVELGGKRGHRRRIAELGRVLSEQEREAAKLAVATQVRRRFVEALAARDRLDLAREVERAFADAAIGVDRRMAAGTASAAERSSIRTSHELSRVGVLRAERDLAATNLALAATWGSTEPSFSTVAGDLEDVPETPSLEKLVERLGDNPEVRRLQTQADRFTASAGLERASWVPDVTLAAGGRHFNDNDDFAAVFEITMPLPVFDRSQGAVLEAEQLAAQSAAEGDARRLERQALLMLAYQKLSADLATVNLLRDEAVPRAREAVEHVVSAYRRGAARLIEVLDAQRLSQAIRNEWIDALVACHLGIIEIERVTGVFIVAPAAVESEQ